MEKELIENHQRYLERVELYRKFGYDIDKERSFVIEKACPFSDNILEAGTGKGYFTLALARLSFHFTSVDISSAEQRYARLNLAYHGLAANVRFDVADLEGLPYPAASFDVIFAVNIVHHLSSVRKTCDELVRIISPSGKIVFSDFNTQGFAIMDKIHALEGKQHELGTGTMTETKAILTEYGFTVNKHQGANQDVLVACRL
jgi:2-polyprenyl-3-methyl-5-hydroxy-6-metoxy-1,4-benzoquinol methylase